MATEGKVRALARAENLLALVFVLLMLLAPAAIVRAEESTPKPLYIENISADLEEALKNRNAAEGKIAKIKAFRAGLSLPDDMAADAKAGAALKAAEETLKKINNGIKLLEESLSKAAQEMLESMGSLARGLKWSGEEQARLAKALNELDFDGDPSATPALIRQTWQSIVTRGRGKEFSEEASMGVGPGFQGHGAGEQTQYNDCAVFAIANAAGVPYGVAAGKAAELIRQGNWRPPEARERPRELIEKSGLNGAEVIMLAESLGQAEVVSSADFARALKDGSLVMVNVTPRSGNSNGGHQVVLTKAFQHEGAPWYEMIDSSQGSHQRLYLSADELDTILQENGIAFRREPGQTPKLLR
jgi:hypothetical protein